MKYHPINSSTITSYGYDEKNRTMAITIKDETFHYNGVDPYHHDAMLTAVSPGAYFNAHIRPRFNAAKVAARPG